MTTNHPINVMIAGGNGGFLVGHSGKSTFYRTHDKAKAHLAMALMLYTGQCRSDAVRMGWAASEGRPHSRPSAEDQGAD